jgi:uncharacterized membrane protein (UPF0182 family)
MDVIEWYRQGRHDRLERSRAMFRIAVAVDVHVAVTVLIRTIIAAVAVAIGIAFFATSKGVRKSKCGHDNAVYRS